MRKSLVAAAIVLISGYIGSAQDKPSARVVIQGAPEQIKKVAVAMFARDGFSLDSQTASQLKISRPFSAEETAAYNTAHWTNEPVSNCRHVRTLVLSPNDGAVAVTADNQMACRPTAGKWMVRTGDGKENESIQDSLIALKSRIEDRVDR